MRLPSLRRSSLADRATDALKRAVLAGELQTGDRLPPERELAESLDVSRTVLRDALGRLIGEGVLHRESPRVLRVADATRSRLDVDDNVTVDDLPLRAMIELRVVLEIGAIELIARRVDAEALERLDGIVEELEARASAGAPITQVDVRFHAALLAAARNTVLTRFLPLIEENLRESVSAAPRNVVRPNTEADRRVVRQHRAIVDALRDGDAERARAEMIAHLEPYLDR